MGEDCKICTREVLTEGNYLLYEGLTFFIMENAKTHLAKEGKLHIYTRRVTLCIKEHLGDIPATEAFLYSKMLEEFVKEILGYSRSMFFIQKTMTSIPTHYHIHAFIHPLLRVEDAGC